MTTTAPKSLIRNVSRRWHVAGLLSVMSVLLAGCVTPGGYGSTYPGGGYGQPAPGQYGDQIVGTVQSVDPSYDRIVIAVDDGRGGYGGRQVALRYDQRTQLVFQGQAYPVEGLERGDVIRVQATQSGREWLARSIEVVRNVRGGGGYDNGYGNDYGNGYGNEVRGSVEFVDTRSRTIRLGANGYGNDTLVNYDGRTVVQYRGQSYRPENLERGDVVRIQSRRVGNNQWLAERIDVERSVRGY